MNCDDKLREFEALFSPRSVAVVGASSTPGKAGYVLVENLLKFGFRGKIYPINPTAQRILGLITYRHIVDIPDIVDLAVVSVPARIVPEIVQGCAEKKIRYVVIITGGFSEAGEEGKRLQDRITQIASEAGTRVIGPNIIGMISTEANLFITFAPFKEVRKGSIGIVAQTGAFCGAALHYLLSYRFFGLSKSVDLGNRCDLSEAELLEYFLCDPQTRIIVLHIEGLKDGRKFLETAKRVSVKKPILVLKFGRTEAGSKAVASHTGSVAGSDSVYSAAFRQAGLLRVDDLDEILYVTRALELLPLPNGNRVCIISFSGAAGAQAADLCAENGLAVPNLASDTISKIKSISPPWMEISNPVDIWPATEMSGDAGKTYTEAIDAALSDENVDSVVVLVNASYVPVRQSPMPEQLVHAVKQPLRKPVAICVIGYTLDTERYAEVLDKKMLPVYSTVKSCVRALSKLYEYSRYRKQI